MLYRMLLGLFPAEFREEFGEEMVGVVRQAASRRNGPTRAAFWWRELTGLMGGAFRDQLRRLIDFDVLPRRLVMRSEFRFPRATWVLMTIILAGVVLAIEKARAISASLPRTNPHLPPIQPVHYVFIGPFLSLFAGAFVLAGLALAVLFALRRAGVHRLEDLATTARQG